MTSTSDLGGSNGPIVTPPMGVVTSEMLSGYFDGCELTKTALSTITTTAGVVRDDTNQVFIRPVAGTIALADVQAGSELNKRDRAANLAVDTMAYVFAVGSVPGADGYIISPSRTAPVLPAGYTYKRFIQSIPIGTVVNQMRAWQSGGFARTLRVEYEPGVPSAQLEVVGAQGAVGGGILPPVTASASWRNIVAGGTNVNFGLSTRLPAAPVGSGGANVKNGVRAIFEIQLDRNGGDYVEFAPAHGAAEAPTSSPANGTGIRRYTADSWQSSVPLEIRVGDGQSIQYRSCNAVGMVYCFLVRGWYDER